MPDRGEVWLASLDPAGPGEQGGTRPVLVISTNAFNTWPVGLVMVVPITTRDRGFAHHIRVAGGGLDRPSFAMPEYLRSSRSAGCSAAAWEPPTHPPWPPSRTGFAASLACSSPGSPPPKCLALDVRG